MDKRDAELTELKAQLSDVLAKSKIAPEKELPALRKESTALVGKINRIKKTKDPMFGRLFYFHAVVYYFLLSAIDKSFLVAALLKVFWRMKDNQQLESCCQRLTKVFLVGSCRKRFCSWKLSNN